jgi:DNA-binding NarL/FixJ family response regulator
VRILEEGALLPPGGLLLGDETEERGLRTGATSVRNFSTRERQVLERLICGESNADIARSVGTTESDVKGCIKTIRRKLNVRNRTQAAIWAYQHQELIKP